MTRGPLPRQVDFCNCIRCGEFSSAAFVFDDGTFYCFRCLNYLKGGDLLGSFQKDNAKICSASEE